MKKFTIVMVIIATVIIATGIGMMVFSGAFGAGGGAWSQAVDKLGNNGNITEKTIEAPASTLKEIDISFINANIDVVEGGDKVTVTYPENSRYEYDITKSDGKISIKEHSLNKAWFLNIFNFNLKTRTITIQIPASVKLTTLNLNAVNGIMTLDSVSVEDTDIGTTNGNIIIKSGVFNTVAIDSTNGSLESKDSVIKDLTVKTTNGSVRIDKGDIGKITLNTVNGGVDAVGMAGKETDYSMDFSTVNGSVTINGKKVSSRGDYRSLTSGARSIKVNTVNGGISLETIQK